MNIFADVDKSVINNLALAFAIIVVIDVILSLLFGKLLGFLRIPRKFIVKIVSIFSFVLLLYLVALFDKYDI